MMAVAENLQPDMETGVLAPVDSDFVRFQRENIALVVKAFGYGYEEARKDMRLSSFDEMINQIIREKGQIAEFGIGSKL